MIVEKHKGFAYQIVTKNVNGLWTFTLTIEWSKYAGATAANLPSELHDTEDDAIASARSLAHGLIDNSIDKRPRR